MKPRKLALGNRNIIGKRVTEARLAQGMKQVDLLAKLQLAGIDLSVPAFSLLLFRDLLLTRSIPPNLFLTATYRAL